jgi:thymidylate synthase (FAD)
MNIRYYSDIKVSLLRATENPLEILQQSMNLPINREGKRDCIARLKDIISMDHHTVLEFFDCTFLLTGVSNALLSQIRTHRMASWMAASHHYVDATQFDLVFKKEPPQRVREALAILFEEFEKHKVEWGKEEARMWLPVASSYNILMKVNGSSLFNFFYKRLCKRNCAEMQVVANKMFDLCMIYLPEVFSLYGPECVRTKCNQGKMSCRKPYARIN